MFLTVTPELYQEILARLTDAIGDRNYFSGSLEFVFEGIACRLRTSVIVYRRTELLPEGTFEVIDDLVPVWWNSTPNRMKPAKCSMIFHSANCASL